MARLTVLICTHNRADLLDRTLVSLNAANRPAVWDIRILVAANACTDGTHSLLDSYKADKLGEGRLPLEWFAVPTPGKSHALNAALPMLGNDLTAFVDDDHRVDPSYLRAVCRAAEENPTVDLFCGRILPDWTGAEPAWVHDQGPYRIYPLPVPRFDLGDAPLVVTADRAIPGGGNLVVHGKWFARVGTFSTDLGPTGHDLGGSEDMDWVLRALALGAKLHYCPDIIQHHYADPTRLTLSYIVRKAYKRTATTVMLDPKLPPGGPPLYLYRKLAGYAWVTLTALTPARKRFSLVRMAATLGEVTGYLRRTRRQPSAQPPHR